MEENSICSRSSFNAFRGKHTEADTHKGTLKGSKVIVASQPTRGLDVAGIRGVMQERKQHSKRSAI